MQKKILSLCGGEQEVITVDNDEKIDRLDDRLRSVEYHQSSLDAKIEIMVANIDRLSQKIDDSISENRERMNKMDERMNKIDERMDKMDERMDKMDIKFEQFDNKIEKLYDRMHNLIVAVCIGGVVGVGAIIATVIITR